MHGFLLRLGWVLALAVVGAFFVPWIKTAPFNHSLARERLVAELAREAEQPWYRLYFEVRSEDWKRATREPLRGESGFDLVRLTHGVTPTEQKKAREQAKVFGIDDLRLAALLVYGLPAVALLGMVLFTLVSARIPLLAVAILSMGFYFFVRHGLDETLLERMLNGVVPGLGLWATLYGLLAVGVLLFLGALLPGGKK